MIFLARDLPFGTMKKKLVFFPGSGQAGRPMKAIHGDRLLELEVDIDGVSPSRA